MKKKKHSTTGLAGGLFGLRGERLLKRARSYDGNTSASPLVRALKLAAFSSLFFSFTKQTASYALTATQARLPCACAQMALACTALSCYFLSDYRDFFVTIGIYTVLPWADVLCGHCNGNVNLLYFSENDTRWSEAKWTNDGNSWTSLHAAL